MFKSLRWRLQLWHTLILSVVVFSFGCIVYDLQWKSRLQQIDAELNRIANTLFQRVRPGPRRPRTREENRPSNEPNPRPEQEATPQAENTTADTSSRPQPGGDSTRPPRMPRTAPAALMEEFARFTHQGEDSQYYLVIWEDKNDVLSSEGAPQIPNPKVAGEADGTLKRVIRERRQGPSYRELILARDYDGVPRNLLIGQSLEKDLSEHRQRGLLLIATGLVILAAGTLGGGWLSWRAIRPINQMTATAESISAQNLSQRINVKDTDSELGNLAKVLNNTFDRLQAAFEQQKQFTADASHELRTPLSVIATHTELALSRPRTGEEYRTALETCQRASKRMRSLIDSLLILARFDSGVPTLKQEPVELEPLIQDCVELVRSLAAEHGIQIELQTIPCQIVGDWDRVSQVITNLLSNSIRYNVKDGWITVGTRIENNFAVISVKDSGIGIAADQLPHVFARFYQVDKARTRTDGGCGLGLSICKTIVEAHGGSMTAVSEPGIGTTIEVRLRLSKPTSTSERSLTKEIKLVNA